MLFFSRKPSIHVFVRHCFFSSASAHKERMRGFSRKRCYENLLQTLDDRDVHLTFFLDGYEGNAPHFLREQSRFPVIGIQAGNEGASFLAMLDHVLKQDLESKAIVYFLEDDYLHKPEWIKILREGFSLPHSDYVTLYDHKDKYFFPEYQNLTARLFHTQSCHWRTTPSTTNTYAMRFKTLKRDEAIHRAFSLNRKITADHEKFCALAKQGAILISSIPGWSTHVEPEYASPCTDWEKILSS
jgi:glycosyltransferase involved in cell wall biosynthesis